LFLHNGMTVSKASVRSTVKVGLGA
jgi:hypothetical protein